MYKTKIKKLIYNYIEQKLTNGRFSFSYTELGKTLNVNRGAIYNTIRSLLRDNVIKKIGEFKIDAKNKKIIIAKGDNWNWLKK